jgi:hypothetical protein
MSAHHINLGNVEMSALCRKASNQQPLFFRVRRLGSCESPVCFVLTFASTLSPQRAGLASLPTRQHWNDRLNVFPRTHDARNLLAFTSFLREQTSGQAETARNGRPYSGCTPVCSNILGHIRSSLDSGLRVSKAQCECQPKTLHSHLYHILGLEFNNNSDAEERDGVRGIGERREKSAA